MKRLPLILIVLFVSFGYTATTYAKDQTASNCSNKDRKYAKFWDNYYDPEEAYNFGRKIKKLVKEKNLKSLFELVEGELTSGPRKEFVNSKKFSEIFSEKWRNSLLESKSPCSPVGWRGFMLDHGSIWFNKDKDKNKWYIFSILGAKKELISGKKLPIGWKVSEKLIPPQCFSTKWMSSDNYEQFAKKFGIKNYKDFSKNPGKYLGKKIPNLEPITASWDKKIYLAAPLKQCFEGNLRGGGIVDEINMDVKISNKSIKTKICSSKFSCQEYAYTILSKVPLKKCKELAPHIDGKCEESFLISVGDYSGGSMGWDMGYNIYGLFSFNDNRKFILPLKNFYKKNDAVNYVKSIK
tara:strand:- start:45 stop:1100 length:1056 start_codon:yes stop_codon:yes gene_type:complete